MNENVKAFIKLINSSNIQMNEKEEKGFELIVECFSKEIDNTKKEQVTEKGFVILNFLSSQEDNKMFTCKEISEEIDISSRQVAGAIRKLVTDGFVEKIGQNPIKYMITEKGKNISNEYINKGE